MGIEALAPLNSLYVYVSTSCIFPAILSNYNRMTAYICCRFILTTAFLVAIFWLMSVWSWAPVQLTAWKDLSLKWSTMCPSRTLNPVHSLTHYTSSINNLSPQCFVHGISLWMQSPYCKDINSLLYNRRLAVANHQSNCWSPNCGMQTLLCDSFTSTQQCYMTHWHHRHVCTV